MKSAHPMRNQWFWSGLLLCSGLVVGLIISFSFTDIIVRQNHVQTPFQAWYSRNLLDDRSAGSELQGKYLSKTSPLSHDEVDQLDQQLIITSHNLASDKYMHRDNDGVAREMYNKVSILCWVMTGGTNHRLKADHVMATWGKRCNKIVFMSDTADDILPVIKFNVGQGREHLTAKTMHAFQYSYKHHMNEADWFLKVDDDSYVILENLRYFLSSHETSEPVYFGHHFQTIVKQGYFSGGGGYVISKEALKRFGKRRPGACREDGGAEDAEFGRCMENLGVKTGDSRDALGRSRFHCFDPETFIHGGYPDWYLQYDKYGAKKGLDAVSDYAITFHYIPVNKMYDLEYYVYHLRPHGIQCGDQDLNRLPSNGSQIITTSNASEILPEISNKIEKNIDIFAKMSSRR